LPLTGMSIAAFVLSTLSSPFCSTLHVKILFLQVLKGVFPHPWLVLWPCLAHGKLAISLPLDYGLLSLYMLGRLLKAKKTLLPPLPGRRPFAFTGFRPSFFAFFLSFSYPDVSGSIFADRAARGGPNPQFFGGHADARLIASSFRSLSLSPAAACPPPSSRRTNEDSPPPPRAPRSEDLHRPRNLPQRRVLSECLLLFCRCF